MAAVCARISLFLLRKALKIMLLLGKGGYFLLFNVVEIIDNMGGIHTPSCLCGGRGQWLSLSIFCDMFMKETSPWADIHTHIFSVNFQPGGGDLPRTTCLFQQVASIRDDVLFTVGREISHPHLTFWWLRKKITELKGFSIVIRLNAVLT